MGDGEILWCPRSLIYLHVSELVVNEESALITVKVWVRSYASERNQTHTKFERGIKQEKRDEL